MNENELISILLSVLIGIVAFLTVWFFIVIICNLLENIYKKNQVKYVEKGYERRFKWFICVRRRILNDETEVRLVELSETSPVHREMLMLYEAQLSYHAAEIYVGLFLKPETYELFKSREVRFYHELDVVIKKAADGDELSKQFLLEYAEDGRSFSDEQITNLSADEKLKHIFKKYCENNSFLKELEEERLIELSCNDESFFEVLSKYIENKKHCSRKEIGSSAEIELYKHKKLFDIQVSYIKITKKCPTGEPFQLLANHAKEEKRYKELLLSLFDVAKKPSDELIEYAIESNDKDFLIRLNSFVKENELDENQQAMLSQAFILDAYSKNRKLYRACLMTHITMYELCENAKQILLLR